MEKSISTTKEAFSTQQHGGSAAQELGQPFGECKRRWFDPGLRRECA